MQNPYVILNSVTLIQSHQNPGGGRDRTFAKAGEAAAACQDY